MSLLAQKWYTPADLAALIGTTAETLATWRADGTGPVFVKISERKVAYIESDVEVWLEARRQKGGNHANGNQKTGRVLALPHHGQGPGVYGKHRFGGHRTKSQARG